MKKFSRQVLAAAMALIIGLSLPGCGGESESGAKTAPSSLDQENEASSEVSSSDKEYEAVSQDVFAMDTYMTVTAYGEEAKEAVAAAADEITRLDKLFSVGEEDSDISVLNRDGQARVSEETYTLIKKGLEINKSTDGASNIAVYPLMDLWGFTGDTQKVPDQKDIDALLNEMDIDGIKLDDETCEVTLPENTKIDLGSIAKGFTSARLMDIFAEYDVRSAMVSLGGNVQVYRDKQDGSKWRVAVENPFDTGSDYQGILEIEDMAVITSGAYERYFEEDGKRYHHILDPSTGYPAESGLSSVTIVSKDGTLADALSTALFVMGKEKAENYWKEHADEFDMVLVEDDGSMEISSGIKDCFTSENDYTVLEK